jgi:hypothetical protein
MTMKAMLLSAMILLAGAAPAGARWTQAEPVATTIAESALSVVPGADWNRWSKRPLKRVEVWSLDGPLLNRLDLYGGIAEGGALARQTDAKRHPLPRFAPSMKATDIADLIERTVRATEQAPDFAMDAIEPATFAGRPGFRLRYHYTSGELTRRGEARGAISDGKLYLIAFSAPALYYFDAGLPRASAIMESARIG